MTTTPVLTLDLQSPMDVTFMSVDGGNHALAFMSTVPGLDVFGSTACTRCRSYTGLIQRHGSDPEGMWRLTPYGVLKKPTTLRPLPDALVHVLAHVWPTHKPIPHLVQGAATITALTGSPLDGLLAYQAGLRNPDVSDRSFDVPCAGGLA